MNQISKLERKDIQEVDFDIEPENESDLELTILDQNTNLYEERSFDKFVEGPETYIENEEDDTPEEILRKLTPKKEIEQNFRARTEC